MLRLTYRQLNGAGGYTDTDYAVPVGEVATIRRLAAPVRADTPPNPPIGEVYTKQGNRLVTSESFEELVERFEIAQAQSNRCTL